MSVFPVPDRCLHSLTIVPDSSFHSLLIDVEVGAVVQVPNRAVDLNLLVCVLDDPFWVVDLTHRSLNVEIFAVLCQNFGPLVSIVGA